MLYEEAINYEREKIIQYFSSYILCAVSVKIGAKMQHLTDQHLETRRLFRHDIIQEIAQAITVTTEQGLTWC